MRYLMSLVALSLFFVAGCSSGPKVRPAESHPPLAKEKVKIFQKEPLDYEVLGTITQPVAPDAKWDEKGEATAGFERLMAAAGAMGANGILLKADPGTTDLTVGAGYNGQFYHVPMQTNPRQAVVKAIYVHVE
jgi:hypothetical protein